MAEKDPIKFDATEFKEEGGMNERTESRIEDIWGNFPMVTGIPTFTPRRFEEGIALDTSISQFYYYDFTNNAWKTVGSVTIFPGRVGADGSATDLPTGWSSARDNDPGEYTVTHNLGTTSYAAVITGGVAGLARIATIDDHSTNSFGVEIRTAADALVNSGFEFILMET